MLRDQVRVSIFMMTMLLLVACQSIYQPAPAPKHSKLNKTAAGYNVQLGMAYLKQKRYARSKRKLLKALEQAPDWPPALDAMAFYLEKTDQIPQAKSYYRKALALAPEQGSTNNNYGTFLCRQGHYQAAIRYFERAVADPHYVDGAEAYENAAMCAEQIPDRRLALRYYRKANHQDPMRPLPLLYLAKHAFKHRQFKRADIYLDRYNHLTEPTAESLWLGIRVAAAVGDQDTLTSDALLLREKFSHSAAYRHYLKSRYWRAETMNGGG